MKLALATLIDMPHGDPGDEDADTLPPEEAPPTERVPFDSSPALDGLTDLVSQVRIRVTARAETLRRRGSR